MIRRLQGKTGQYRESYSTDKTHDDRGGARMGMATIQRRGRGVYECAEVNAATDKGGRLSIQSGGGVGVAWAL